MRPNISYLLITFLLCAVIGRAQSTQCVVKVVDAKSNAAINASVWDEINSNYYEVDKFGNCVIPSVGKDSLSLTIFCETYASQTLFVPVTKDTFIVFMNPLLVELEDFVIVSEGRSQLVQKLNNVRGMGVYAGKKSELLLMRNFKGNNASNNAREIFASIPGLNIWENDASGLQLNIGARGLDPNRTAHFNTRQNGYDISADALGYPETYYTPPVQALKQIEIVRGAASLQFGPQFGGMLNFVLKDESKKPFSFETINSISSNAQLSTYNAIGGTKGVWKYYAYGFFKKGDGYRPNSAFEQRLGFGRIAYNKKRIKVRLEHTAMDYLARLPGGLVDFEFETDPFISKRSRNWFSVNWNLTGLQIDYAISPRTRLQNRTFMLNASRKSVGELGPINRPDPLSLRDLIIGRYSNIGSELRFLHQYKMEESLNTILVGFRWYNGNTRNKQGFANASEDASFEFLNPAEPQVSSYRFPGSNLAFFAEHVFNFSDKLYISPGFRLEQIITRANGYYYNRVYAGSELIFEERRERELSSPRTFPLFGMGIAYKIGDDLRKEIYLNGSQNFRSINFTDISISNPNLIVDQDLTDERGYNFEMGIRGQSFEGNYSFDVNVFYLSYQNRIGLTSIVLQPENRIAAYRTNIGDAQVLGIESFQQLNFKPLRLGDKEVKAYTFLNFAYQKGTYIRAESAIIGNRLEKIPPFSVRAGFNIDVEGYKFNVLFSHIAQQYTDATNATFVADATRGVIPSYEIVDVSLSKKFGRLDISAGVNNVLNRIYFTQRAVSYPGPGIMTAAPRLFHTSIGFKF
jgi:Fe(3+) dicitrate transport protein